MTTGRRVAAVASALVLTGCVLFARLTWRAHADPLAALATAVGPHLDFDARPSGGFAPRAARDVRRSAAAIPTALPPDARIAIATIEMRAASDHSTAALAALGTAYLVDGQIDLAITTLEESTSLVEAAPAWNDLSAAYLVKAERASARRVEHLARALDAASRSLTLAPSNEARFNRALALEALSAYVGPTNGWAEYLKGERDSRWIDVVKRRAASAAAPGDARASWEERKTALPARLASRDTRFVAETATLFPEAALEFLDQQILGSWARARAASDRPAAATALAHGAVLATALKNATQDQMAADTIAIATRESARASGAALARAHLAYQEAVKGYRADDYSGAIRHADAAIDGFTRAGSPHWAWATLQKATILFQQRDLERSEAALTAVERFARERRYATLLGRTLRQRGITQSKQWRLTEALAAFQEAAACFESATEREDAAAVYSLIAANLRMLGEHHESWEYIGRTLSGLGRMQSPLRRYLVLFNASLFALNQELYESALLFQNAAVEQARVRGGAPVVEALTQRATVYVRRGEQDAAVRDLNEARRLIELVSDDQLKRGLRAEADILLAELKRDERTQPRIDGLDDAVRFFAKVEPSFVPRLYLALARAQLAAGAVPAAERAFDDGIAQLEEQQSRLDNEAFRISYFDESWSLFPEMIAFQSDVRRDPAKAFDYAERSRARSLLRGAPPVGLHALERSVPGSAALVYYVTLPDRLLTWVVANGASSLSDVRVRRDDLARLIARHRTALSEGRADAAANGARLYDLLIRPVARRLPADAVVVFVADGDLQRLPFATLRNPASNRFLIEEHPVLVAPSASFFAAGLGARSSATRPAFESALLIGNPVSGPDASLPPLPGAEAEAAAAAAFYPRHELLIGAAATKRRFLESAPAHDVVHFGGHAVANPEYPLLSRLSFAPDRRGGSADPLFAHEISRLRLDRTRLVVLGACSTAAGVVSRGEGVVSVARPFLAAGVPTVVASQWDVGDRATEKLLLAFHRALAATRDPVKALQVAQLSLLRSGNATLASPENWGAFVALGRTSF